MSNCDIELSWDKLKEICRVKRIRMQYVEYPDKYDIFAKDLDITYSCIIFKDPSGIIGLNAEKETQNKTDFEQNYKNDANRPLFLSPIEGESQFLSMYLEIPENQGSAYYEWDFGSMYNGKDVELKKVRPRPVQAKRGDECHLEVWTKPGVMGPDPVKIRSFGYTQLRGGDGWFGMWYEGVGTARIPSYVTVRLVYDKNIDLSYREFYLDLEVIV